MLLAYCTARWRSYRICFHTGPEHISKIDAVQMIIQFNHWMTYARKLLGKIRFTQEMGRCTGDVLAGINARWDGAPLRDAIMASPYRMEAIHVLRLQQPTDCTRNMWLAVCLAVGYQEDVSVKEEHLDVGGSE